MRVIFDVRLTPKDPLASIAFIVVRVDDPTRNFSMEELLDFIEKQFPFYTVHAVIAGYRSEDEDESTGSA